MTPHELKERHVKLHRSFDELLACFYIETGDLAKETTLMEFMEWSHKMTINPTCHRYEHGD